ncbi:MULTISPECIES: DNA polymerase III subunit gamma/tau [Cysteiniphilum]|uniref:DNA polymerase III subunit gamma/tau n=1 Tax=Cysteiniphilum litorale TaxID=2056700 RepID=A0A8J2Z252_9GAMM|nr:MULTISPECIES: DNA polymerase III subunit gamma/tau [Cysteiniphilum]GGF88922.1 DNA polymerase III subunit gamma/tau [Cysteiniphilum litorale]
MSYQVLARKYRPKNFSEVVGQQHVLNSLIHALDQNRLHHAYLFTGTRGVGKTSLARLLAKSVNCLNGVSSHPCGQCEHCVAIEQGRFVDLIEIDAASRTKVEDTRDILDNVQYMPSQGKYKIYLIDEVHMLSQHSFNALLKTLEEPPEHVKFLLATTDPHKLPITILSRCLQFNLKHLSETQIEQKLVEILGLEAIAFEQNALKIIAHAADGSMRDALSLTDQSIAYSKGEILTYAVQTMLGIVDKEMIDKLVIALLEEDTNAIINFSDDIILAGKSPQSVLNALAECFYYASLIGFNAQHLSSIPCSDEILKTISEHYSKDTLQLYYQLTIKAKEDLHLAPNAQCGLGMALLRLCAFSLDLLPASQTTNNAGSLTNTKTAPNLSKKPDLSTLKKVFAAPSESHSVSQAHKPAIIASVTDKAVTPSLVTEDKTFNKPIKPMIAEEPTSDSKHMTIEKAETVADNNITTAPKTDTTVNDTNSAINNSKNSKIDWYHLSQSLGLKGTTLQIVLNSSLLDNSGNIYTLQTSDSVKALITTNAIKKIEDALSLKQGRNIKVTFSHLNQDQAPTKANANTTLVPPADQVAKQSTADATSAATVISPIDHTVETATPPVATQVTPAQVIQQQKAQKIDEIYTSLKADPEIQNLEQLGFQLNKSNIKLKD